MNSLGLHLFHQLCAVGNALESWRDTYTPASDEWTALTDLLGMLDEAVDMLVRSEGLGGDNDETVRLLP